MAKDVKKKDAGAKEKKKENGFIRGIKSLFTELKKVTWPKFPTVLKQTLVVLGVTVAFLALVMLIDAGLGEIYKLFISKL